MKASSFGGLLAASLVAVGVVGIVAVGPAYAEIDRRVASSAETSPGTHNGDSMDDPAIWVHPTDPARSLVIGNDKQGALETYDLQGDLVQRITSGGDFFGNVDVRQGVRVDGVLRDVVAVAHDGVTLYRVEPDSRQLVEITESVRTGGSGEGLCLYHDRSVDELYVVQITIRGRLRQYQLVNPDGDAELGTVKERDFEIGSEAEGCVVNDETGELFVSEEDEAIWRYDADPEAGQSREAVVRVGGAGSPVAADLEGLALADDGAGRTWLIASSQNVADPSASYFSVFAAWGGYAFRENVRVVDGSDSDDCDRTDGIAATSRSLGASFPGGLFVCQDNANARPGSNGNQNFKLVALRELLG